MSESRKWVEVQISNPWQTHRLLEDETTWVVNIFHVAPKQPTNSNQSHISPPPSFLFLFTLPSLLVALHHTTTMNTTFFCSKIQKNNKINSKKKWATFPFYPLSVIVLLSTASTWGRSATLVPSTMPTVTTGVVLKWMSLGLVKTMVQWKEKHILQHQIKWWVVVVVVVVENIIAYFFFWYYSILVNRSGTFLTLDLCFYKKRSPFWFIYH